MTILSDLPSLHSPYLRSGDVSRRRSNTRGPIRGAAALAAVDGCIAIVALVAILVTNSFDALPRSLENLLAIPVTLRHVLLLILLIAVWRLVFHLCGLYEKRGLVSAAAERLRVCLACAAGSLLTGVVPELSAGSGLLRHRPIFFFFIATTAATVAVRESRRALLKRRERRTVLIVGTGMRALALWRRLEHDDEFEYELAGFLDTVDSIPASPDISRRRLGTLDMLEHLLMRHAIDEVHIALPVRSRYPDIQQTILICEQVGVRAKYQADLFESQVAWPRYDDPASPTVTMHVVPSDYRLIVKRTIDIAGATTAVVLLMPVMLAVALAVRASGPGPIIFAQERYGLNRHRFRMLKFRTMRPDAEQLQSALEARNEADGPVFKIADDPRVTRIGRFLRRTSLDELPQFLNVLRGEMSLVGPRPLPLRDVARFTSAADMRRFSVRPGLTCLWQISGRSTLSFSDWIRLDLAYIDRWSLGLDLLILLRTVPAVVFGTGAR